MSSLLLAQARPTMMNHLTSNKVCPRKWEFHTLPFPKPWRSLLTATINYVTTWMDALIQTYVPAPQKTPCRGWPPQQRLGSPSPRLPSAHRGFLYSWTLGTSPVDLQSIPERKGFCCPVSHLPEAYANHQAISMYQFQRHQLQATGEQ